MIRKISEDMENKTTQQLIEELSQTIATLRQSLLGVGYNEPGQQPAKPVFNSATAALSRNTAALSDKLAERIRKSSMEIDKRVQDEVTDKKDNNIHDTSERILQDRVVRQASLDAPSLDDYCDSLRESEASLDFNDDLINNKYDLKQTPDIDSNRSLDEGIKNKLEFSTPTHQSYFSSVKYVLENSKPVLDFLPPKFSSEIPEKLDRAEGIELEKSEKQLSTSRLSLTKEQLIDGIESDTHRDDSFTIDSLTKKSTENICSNGSRVSSEKSITVKLSVLGTNDYDDGSIKPNSHISADFHLLNDESFDKSASTKLTISSLVDSIQPDMQPSKQTSDDSIGTLLSAQHSSSSMFPSTSLELTVSDVSGGRLTTCGDSLIITDRWQGSAGFVKTSTANCYWRDNDNIAAWANSISCNNNNNKKKSVLRERKLSVNNHFSSPATSLRHNSILRKNSLDLGIVEEIDTFEDNTTKLARNCGRRGQAERKFSNLFNIAENDLDKDVICDSVETGGEDFSNKVTPINSPIQAGIFNEYFQG